MDLSIIIVSYNTCRLTLECIKSVYEQTKGIDFEIIVVDNASSDGSAGEIIKEYPEIRLIRSKENLGFARANNLAADYAEGDYLLLLNSDTVVLEGAVQKLFYFAEGRTEADIFGGSTFFADGSRNPSSCWSKPTLWSTFCIASGLTSLFRNIKLFNPESFTWWDWSEPREVDIISGCFLLIRKKLWNTLNGFSPDFFMYGEDADLCLRAGNSGSKCVVYQEAQIIHYGGASDSVRADKMLKLITGKKRFFEKHWSSFNNKIGFFLLDIWAFNRMCIFFLLSLFQPERNDSYISWKTVWKNRKT